VHTSVAHPLFTHFRLILESLHVAQPPEVFPAHSATSSVFPAHSATSSVFPAHSAASSARYPASASCVG
jgi:hypothetical protein